jgi:glycosyltransferase involved in cell wall biosynthesis
MACAIAVRKGAFDIFHPTYYDPRCVASLRGKPFVITIHDMIHELFPGDFPNSSVPEGKKQLAMKARRIIAISETTKRDIVRLYGIDDAKIDVIYHGNSLTLPADGPRPTCLPARYLLFVGNRGIYKNFRLCTEAFARLTPDDPLLSLVCVGGPFSGPEVGLLQSLGIADKVKQMQVSDETLALAYQYALAFVFPSLYEGFGIPLLEAFSCECPVIASRASCFPEIAADAAEYFDPADTGSLLEAIKKVILVPGRAKELRELGRLRARSFTWEKTCLETLASYMRALGEAA